MSYLIPRDFNKSIQTDNLNQVIGSDTGILSAAELTAIEEAKSYLVQKYDTDSELTDTAKWDSTVIYHAADRVYLDQPIYNSHNIYAVGDIITSDGNEYKCNTDATTGTFNPPKWDLICPQNQIFYVGYPHPLFNYQSFYNKSDLIFYKGFVYTSLNQTSGYDHASYLQLGNTTGQPYGNVFPDAPNGSQYWGSKTAFTVIAGTDILNSKWVKGDNRSQQLVTYLIDIALYHVHSRIAPRNIPDLRIKRYDDAKNWLKACAKGDVTAAMPVLQPRQGSRIRFGGNVKNQNSY